MHCIFHMKCSRPFSCLFILPYEPLIATTLNIEVMVAVEYQLWLVVHTLYSCMYCHVVSCSSCWQCSSVGSSCWCNAVIAFVIDFCSYRLLSCYWCLWGDWERFLVTGLYLLPGVLVKGYLAFSNKMGIQRCFVKFSEDVWIAKFLNWVGILEKKTS